MADFDAEAAARAADQVTPPESPVAPAPTSSPAYGPVAPAPVASAPIRPVAGLTERVAVEFIDQSLYMVLKRKAKKLGLQIGPRDRDALKLSEVEKDELLLFAPGVMPYIAQYADLIGKMSLALFGFALWSIYQDKSAMLETAARIAAEQAKGKPGFGATRPENGAAPAVPFDPSQVKGIPVHGS